ncbi:hypothetical protein ACFCXT_09960 [Streptomyces vinaceus]|uniref:hypothetical protein n=1 Tax=Streptomyces vinaceus TaxID=1960 RepID=UPI0035D82223
MPGKEVSDLIPVLAVPLLTAALGGLGLMLKDARKRKDFEHRCKTRLEMAALEVEFVSNWMQARKSLGYSPGLIQEAEAWLERCYRSTDAVVRETSRRPQLSRLRRLLLLQPLAGQPARAFRIFYWGAFLAFNTLTILGLRRFVQWVAPGGESVKGSDIFFILVILAAFAFFTASLRKTALAMDEQAKNPQPYPDSWLARPAPVPREQHNWSGLVILLTILAVLAVVASLFSYLYVAVRRPL